MSKFTDKRVSKTRTKARACFHEKLDAALDSKSTAPLAKLIVREHKANVKHLFFTGQSTSEWKAIRGRFRGSFISYCTPVFQRMRIAGFPDSECLDVLKAEIDRLSELSRIVEQEDPYFSSPG